MTIRLVRACLGVAVALLLASAAPAAAAGVTCDRWASPFGSDANPGTQAFPLKSAQKLSDNLGPGQTGCLMSGTYTDVYDQPYVLRANYGGTPGAPVTIRSAPGQRATLRGIVYVPERTNYYTISNLNLDVRKLTPDKTVGIQIMGNDTILEDNDITNAAQAICTVLGSPGWGKPLRPIIRRNTFHDCGGTSNFLEHSLYIEYTDGGLVQDNLFLRSGAYAIHFYPDAHNTTVTHNVMVDNSAAVIFAGEGDSASTDNVVSQNIIAGSYRRSAVYSFWAGGQVIGTGNLAKDNCLYNPAVTNVDISGGGYQSVNNVIAQPKFRDPANGDYRLAPDSPCFGLVGYDTAAKLRGENPNPPATPTPTPTPAAAPTTTPTAAPTAAPTASPSPTRTPSPTPVPTQTPAPVAPAATTVPVTTSAPTPPPAEDGTQPVPDPEAEPVEAAKLFIDDEAFSASGGSAKPACRKAKKKRCGPVPSSASSRRGSS